MTILILDTSLFCIPDKSMNSLHLPEDLWAEGKQGFGVLFSLNIKRMFLMHPESFHHFRIEKCLPQLGGIIFTFLCFPISFLPDLPPPQKLSSLLPYWKPALHTFFSSCLHTFFLLFFYSQAFPSAPACFLSHITFPHLPHPPTVLSSFCCCGTKQCWKISSSALRGSGRFRRASEPWRNLQQQLLHVCLWVQRDRAP